MKVNIGSGNDLLPGGAKPLSDPMLIQDLWHPSQCNLIENAEDMLPKLSSIFFNIFMQSTKPDYTGCIFHLQYVVWHVYTVLFCLDVFFALLSGKLYDCPRTCAAILMYTGKIKRYSSTTCHDKARTCVYSSECMCGAGITRSIFFKNSHNRHHIARPWGQGMGCLIYVLSLSSQHWM